jgi:hypothetical protein
MSDRVSLSKAALLLRKTYHQVRALVLSGRLKGGVDDAGRWYVDGRDLKRQVRQALAKSRDPEARHG